MAILQPEFRVAMQDKENLKASCDLVEVLGNLFEGKQLL